MNVGIQTENLYWSQLQILIHWKLQEGLEENLY